MDGHEPNGISEVGRRSFRFGRRIADEVQRVGQGPRLSSITRPQGGHKLFDIGATTGRQATFVVAVVQYAAKQLIRANAVPD